MSLGLETSLNKSICLQQLDSQASPASSYYAQVMSKLLIRPKRHPEECIVSYLIRISERNGFHHVGHLLQHAGLSWKNLRGPTHQMITGEYDIEQLCTNLGLNHTKPRTERIFKQTQGPSFTTKVFVKTPKVCPKCLENDGYCSDIWSYISYTACIKHKTLLVDTNPSTGKRLSWYRSSLDRFSEEYPLPPSSALIKASSATISLSKTIAALATEDRQLKSVPSVLKGLNFAEALSLLHFIAHYKYRLFHSEIFSPASLDNLTVSHHYVQAWEALTHWPKGFFMLLSQYIDNPMSQRGKRGINKHFRDIHEKLYRQRDNKGIALLRASFDQFIDLNWPNAIQTNRLTRIRLSDDERPLISQKQAQRILNCRAPRIQSLVSQKKISLHQFKGKAYFNKKDIESLAKLYEENWSMEQAIAETELSRYHLKQLLDVELVKSLQKADHQNRDWLICRKSWLRFISNLQKSAQCTPVNQGKTLIGFQKQGFPITDIFNLILQGEVIYNFFQSQSNPYSFKQITNYKLRIGK